MEVKRNRSSDTLTVVIRRLGGLLLLIAGISVLLASHASAADWDTLSG